MIEALLERYELYAQAAGFSQSQVNNVKMVLRLFAWFLVGIMDAGAVTSVDFQRYLVGAAGASGLAGPRN